MKNSKAIVPLDPIQRKDENSPKKRKFTWTGDSGRMDSGKYLIIIMNLFYYSNFYENHKKNFQEWENF